MSVSRRTVLQFAALAAGASVLGTGNASADSFSVADFQEITENDQDCGIPLDDGQTYPGEYQNEAKFLADEYGIPVSQGTDNKIDLPSTYPFNTERFLAFQNDTRNDNPVAEDWFDDSGSEYHLQPAAGETVEFRVRELPRYVPGKQSVFGIGWFAPDLPTGATVEIGLKSGDGQEKFATEYNANNQATSFIQKGGTILSQDTYENPVNLEQPQIDRPYVNMYGVGSFIPNKFFLAGEENNAQSVFLNRLTQLGVNDQSNTNQFNLHLFVRVDNTNGIRRADVRSLSIQYFLFGDVDPTTRPKPVTIWNDSGSLSVGARGTSNYFGEALYGIRADPDRPAINAEITQFNVLPDTTSAAVILYGFNPDDLSYDPANFDTWITNDQQNTIIEINGRDTFNYPLKTVTDPMTGVSQDIPDAGRILTDTIVDLDQQGNQPPTSDAASTETNRTILNDDIILAIPYKKPSATFPVGFEYNRINTEQDW